MLRLILLSILYLLCHSQEIKTLLSIAAEKNNAEEIQTLLTAGSDPNERSKEGESVLHLVCIWGGAKKAELLLSAGADPNHRSGNNGKIKSSLDMTPLSWCSYAGYTDTIAEFIKDKRTEVNMIVKQEDGKCITALDIAIKIGEERGTSSQDVLRKAGGVKYEELHLQVSAEEMLRLQPPSGCPEK